MIRVLEPGRESVANIQRLADMVKTDYDSKHLALPTLVGIPRSSYLLLDAFSRRWQVSGVNILHACVEKQTSPQGKTSFVTGQFPTSELVTQKDLLIVDAICKTGETLGYVKDRMLWLGAKSVKTAVLYDKAKPSDRVIHKPDFFIEDGVDHYTLFEWETDLPEHPVNIALDEQASQAE